MGKRKNRQRRAESRAVATGRSLEAAMNAASAQMGIASGGSTDPSVTLSKAEKQAVMLFRGVADRNNKPRRIGADVGGAGGALLSSIAIEAGVMWVSQYSNWVAERVDYFQAAPQALLGLIAYWAEMWTRQPADVLAPTFTREVAREYSKALATVGLSNLWRAFTVRNSKKAQVLAQSKAVEAERDALRAQLDALLKGK